MQIKDYIGKYNELTNIVLNNFVSGKKNENIVFSPLSIVMLLAIAAGAVQGKSKEEIVSVLGGEISFDEVKELFKEFQSVFGRDKWLKSSNAVCVNNSIKQTINPDYEKELQEFFDGQLFVSENIVNDVNKWVSEKTNGMIKEAADDSMKDMLACLINAIAFEAKWERPYEAEEIFEDEFHNADGTTCEVDMMASSEDYYIEDDRFNGFIKAYKGGDYVYMALLPKKHENSAVLQSAVRNIDFTSLMNTMEYCEVSVTMPQFSYDFGEDLTQLCKDMGIRTPFTPEADFSPLSSAQLMVDAIIHKAHIEVDSQGTKAAAITEELAVAGCCPNFDLKEVYLDRPFVYAIIHTETRLPVFVGVLNHVG
ncbi:serpin family protein [Butyrivibrio sp. VCB2006]|uniref:serpin family protein n=1 Tax=Butyrivibrio sp. VCB2006 TaxID=1280679 RepID=UPI000406CAC4|nr:serpin family protein [Butyrivibrio sp. VCB2006]